MLRQLTYKDKRLYYLARCFRVSKSKLGRSRETTKGIKVIGVTSVKSREDGGIS